MTTKMVLYGLQYDDNDASLIAFFLNSLQHDDKDAAFRAGESAAANACVRGAHVESGESVQDTRGHTRVYFIVLAAGLF